MITNQRLLYTKKNSFVAEVAFQRGWNRKVGTGNKDVKNGGGKLGQGVGALKRGPGTPLRTMPWVLQFVQQISPLNFASVLQQLL